MLTNITQINTYAVLCRHSLTLQLKIYSSILLYKKRITKTYFSNRFQRLNTKMAEISLQKNVSLKLFQHR